VTTEAAVTAHGSISDIGREAWDACANPSDRAVNPFVSFDFLDALEESGSTAPKTGWAPRHLTVVAQDGKIAGALPLYLKSHSSGEYVFDWAWAEAYENAGGRYYPKLLCGVPFTPVTAPKFLVREAAHGAATRRLLLMGALELCEQTGASSLHVNFPVEDEWRWLGAEGLLQRQDQQYHWLNEGYASFDDFLRALSSGRRKTIRRERREAQKDVEIKALTGGEIREEHWDAFSPSTWTQVRESGAAPT
jgi:predicted N-acyltransferase